MMTAAELDRLNEMYAETEHLQNRLNAIRNASEVSATNYSQTAAGIGTGDRVSRTVLSVMDVEDKIRRAQACMLDIIDTISDAKTRKICRRRYIDRRTWSQITDEMGYIDADSARRRWRRFVKAVKFAG